jgi:hypothetical protein
MRPERQSRSLSTEGQTVCAPRLSAPNNKGLFRPLHNSRLLFERFGSGVDGFGRSSFGRCLRRWLRTHFIRRMRPCRRSVLVRVFGAQIPALAVSQAIQAIIPVTTLRSCSVWPGEAIICCAARLNSHIYRCESNRDPRHEQRHSLWNHVVLMGEDVIPPP